MTRSLSPTYYDRPDHPSLRRDTVRESRRCESCGHPRVVLVRYRPVGDRRAQDGSFLWRQDVLFAERCSACLDEAQARKYEDMARKLRARAAQVRARRAEKYTATGGDR